MLPTKKIDDIDLKEFPKSPDYSYTEDVLENGFCSPEGVLSNTEDVIKVRNAIGVMKEYWEVYEWLMDNHPVVRGY